MGRSPFYRSYSAGKRQLAEQEPSGTWGESIGKTKFSAQVPGFPARGATNGCCAAFIKESRMK
jgi:hypothetical protein